MKGVTWLCDGMEGRCELYGRVAWIGSVDGGVVRGNVVCVLACCVECLKGKVAARGGGVVESRKGVGVVSRDSVLEKDVHIVYVSLR